MARALVGTESTCVIVLSAKVKLVHSPQGRLVAVIGFPDIFAAALALTGGPAASAIVIGDTPYDVLAARRAGIDAIAVLSGGFAREELASCGPVAIYESVADLDRNYETSPIAAAKVPSEDVHDRLSAAEAG